MGPGWSRVFPGVPASVTEARRFAMALLNGWPEPLREQAELLVSETCTNALVHSRSGEPGGKFTVHVCTRSGGWLWIEVEDEGGPGDVRVRAGDGESGNGLVLVDAIASDWGTYGDGAGRSVWFRLDVPEFAGRGCNG